MAKILIVGCGAIGRELGNLLSDSGHEVTGLKRNPPEVNLDKFSYYQADITDSTSLIGLDQNFEVVFFIVSPDQREVSSYQAIYHTGLNHLIKILPNAAWFFVSSTSVYAQNKGEWIDEDSSAVGNSPTSQCILAAEQKLQALNPNNVVVRFSGIYGPGREYLLRQAQQGASIQFDPPYYTNRIHQRDCVAVLAFLFNQQRAGINLHNCYLASDHEPATSWDVMSWLAQAGNYPVPTVKTVAGDADMNKRCRNTRLTALGYRFIYPDFRAGYSELIHSANRNQI